MSIEEKQPTQQHPHTLKGEQTIEHELRQAGQVRLLVLSNTYIEVVGG